MRRRTGRHPAFRGPGLVLLAVVLLLALGPASASPDVTTPVVSAQSGGATSTASAWPDQVHLSWVGDPSTTMAVTWRTATDAAGPYLMEWWTAADGEPAGSVAATGEPAPGGRGVLHKAELAGLQPDTEYRYRLAGDGGVWGEELSFRTAPATLPDAGVSFTVNGDVGTSYMFIDVAPIMRRLALEPPGLHLIAGDLTYADLYRGTEEEEHWFSTDLAVVASRRPVLVAWGNHEYYQGADVGIDTVTRYFQLPRTGRPNACNPFPFYSLTYAGILIVALDDSASPCFDRAAQESWLDRTLAASATDPSIAWTVVVVHGPPFSSGCHGSEPLNRYPAFDRYGVDLVISAHDHDYERSWPVSWDGADIRTDYAAPPYPAYLVAGVGGASTYDCVSSNPWSAFFDPGQHVGFVRITALPASLRAEFVAKPAYDPDAEFRVLDQLTLLR